jgi:hypothetical protein
MEGLAALTIEDPLTFVDAAGKQHRLVHLEQTLAREPQFVVLSIDSRAEVVVHAGYAVGRALTRCRGSPLRRRCHTWSLGSS